jgi:hypothetical protein
MRKRKFKMEMLTLTVGIAVATVATTAAFAPAITPSTTYQRQNNLSEIQHYTNQSV